jgi:hypothetical protein
MASIHRDQFCHPISLGNRQHQGIDIGKSVLAILLQDACGSIMIGIGCG